MITLNQDQVSILLLMLLVGEIVHCIYTIISIRKERSVTRKEIMDWFKFHFEEEHHIFISRKLKSGNTIIGWDESSRDDNETPMAIPSNIEDLVLAMYNYFGFTLCKDISVIPGKKYPFSVIKKRTKKRRRNSTVNKK